MDQLAEALMDAFKEYHDLQQAQLAALDVEAHPDLAGFTAARSAAFENLKNRLTQLLKMLNQNNDAKSLHLADTCREEVSRLLERDEALSARILEYRESLRTQLARLSKGRRALSGYAPGAVGAAPRLVRNSS